MKSERIQSYDFLKFIAAILIVFHHYQQLSGGTLGGLKFYGGLFDYGYLVEFFFLISGFVMISYLPKIKEGLSFSVFMKKRMLRLLPTVAFSVIVFELLLYLYSHFLDELWMGLQPSVWGSVTTMLGIQYGWGFENPQINNPLWYVSSLLLCYVVFYLLTVLGKRLKINPAYFYGAMVFVGIGLNTYDVNYPFLETKTGRGYCAFFFGVLLGLLLQKYKITWKKALGALTVIVSLVVLMIYKFYMVENGLRFNMLFLFYPSLLVFFGWKPVSRLFAFSFWRIIGGISYHIYVWHVPLYLAVTLFDKVSIAGLQFDSIKSLLLFTGGCVVCGSISYLVMECLLPGLYGKKGMTTQEPEEKEAEKSKQDSL